MTLIIVGAEHVDLYPSGRRLPALPAGRPMAALLAQCQRSFGREGTVIIRPDALELFGLPATLPRRAVAASMLVEAKALGWFGTERIGSAWVNLWKPGTENPDVRVLIWAYAETNEILDKGDPSGTLERLNLFQQVLGGCYHTSPGVTGTSLLRGPYAPVYKGAPAWAPSWKNIPPAQKDFHTEHALKWEVEQPPAGKAVAHIYDANRARLRYAGTAKFAKGELTHHDRPKFSTIQQEKLAGYVRISRPAWQVAGFPHPAGYRPATAQQVVTVKDQRIVTEWVAVPTLELLMEVAEQGYCQPPLIFEGWLAPGTTLLRRWADALESAYALQPALREIVKEIYRGTSGQILRGSARFNRPDWNHTWLSEERSRLWRKWWQAWLAGHAPMLIETDAAWYPTDDPDWRTAMPAALTLGEGLGQFHPLGTWLLDPDGRPVTGDDGEIILIEADWLGESAAPGVHPSITDHILAQRALRTRA